MVMVFFVAPGVLSACDRMVELVDDKAVRPEITAA